MPKPYYDHAGVQIYLGDCREILPEIRDRFDACVTDPPYHLTQSSRGGSPRQNDPKTPFGRTRLGSAGFMGKTWDGGDVAFQIQTWEVIRAVLKPGAHVMAFGGTRTFHRLACAIEDAGFEMRDMLMWLYGSGFPKSLDISKAIDKKAGAEREVTGPRVYSDGTTGHFADAGVYGAVKDQALKYDSAPATDAAKLWDGYGTALKPAWEPIILAMRPCDGTFAENALENGVAGLNIDGSRIGWPNGKPEIGTPGWGGPNKKLSAVPDQIGETVARSEANDLGRWPANLLLDEEAAAMFPDAPGQLADASTNPDSRRNQNVYGTLKRGSPEARSRDHEASSTRRYTDNGGTNFSALPGIRRLDTGSAARFFYTAKADSNERGTGNNHPTVKPLDLMRYLCKLLCPPSGGLFLEPFSGSGTTLMACKALNIRAVGIELDEHYAEIAAKRLSQDVLEFQ